METFYEVVAQHDAGNQTLIDAITYQLDPPHDSLGLGRDGSVEWCWSFDGEAEARSLITMLSRITGVTVELYRHGDDHSDRLGIDERLLTAA